eukprot:1917049-Pleurochrysis_carterae.AAC.1
MQSNSTCIHFGSGRSCYIPSIRGTKFTRRRIHLKGDDITKSEFPCGRNVGDATYSATRLALGILLVVRGSEGPSLTVVLSSRVLAQSQLRGRVRN